MPKATSTEHDEQCAYFQWVGIMGIRDKRYKNIYAIPNGGHRHIGVARKLKREGVKSGVLDINVDWPMGNYHGLKIEMKVGYNKASPNQKIWIERFENAGYKVEVCYSSIEAIEATKKYFSLLTQP